MPANIIFSENKDKILFISNFKNKIIIDKKGDINIKDKDYYLAKKIIKKHNIKAQILERKKRLILYVILITLLSISIFSCQLNFNNSYEVIVSSSDEYLKNMVQTYINNLDEKITKNNYVEYKNKIICMFEDVSFCEINVDKNIVNIFVKKEENFQIENKKRQNIYANSDGIITKIILKSGTSQIKINDVVKKGDLLVAGYIEKQNGEDRIKVFSDAEIFAKCYIKDSFIIAKNQIQLVRTNKKTKSRQNSLIKKRCKFKFYDEQILQKSFLGIKYIEHTYYEKVKIEKELKKEDIDAIALNEITQKCVDINKFAKLLNSRYEQKIVDNFYHLDIYYEIEQCISIEGGQYRDFN